MDMSALTLLVDILDAGNLSQAARKLKMTRANVSYHLAQLEKSVGQQLVRRTTRRIEPTEIGLRLYQHGLAIQNELLAAQETVTTLGQSLQGRVRLSVPSGYGQMVMTDWLIEFKRLYPGIVLDVLFGNRVDDLMRDEVDIAIRVMPEPPQTLVARELGVVRYVACASREFAAQHGLPTELEQLRSAPLITSAVIGRHLRLSAYFGPSTARGTARGDAGANLDFGTLSVSAPGHFGRAGRGLVPDYVVQDALQTGQIVTTLADYRLSIFGTQLYMLYMPNRHQTRRRAP